MTRAARRGCRRSREGSEPGCRWWGDESSALNIAGRAPLLDPFRGLPNQLIDHRMEAAGPLERCQLAVGAGPLGQDPVGVLDFSPAPEIVEHVVHEPLDQLADEIP